MSVLQLAELLVPLQKDTVAYIVLSHELNLKIAKCQAKATSQAGWISAAATIIGAFVTFALGYFIGTSQPKGPSELASKPAVTAPTSQLNTAIANPTPLAPVVQIEPLKLGSSVDNNAKKERPPSNASPRP
ncbi:MAG: hypothetical protein LZF86_110902 [Nitrospira sp.]|nr:MAG: hypothetical protein LZF86_110902 [Nitrospira sp.]